MKLLEGHNWVYTMHVLLVAPLLILIPLAYLFKSQWKLTDTMINAMMYLLIGFGVTVFFYHGNKLRKVL